VTDQILQITTPTWNAVWEPGTKNTVQWLSGLIGVPKELTLELWNGGNESIKIIRLGTFQGSAGEATIKLPQNLPNHGRYCIFAYGMYKGQKVSGFSPLFTVQLGGVSALAEQQPIQFIFPNTNSSWQADMVYNIIWTMYPVPPTVTLELWQTNQATILLVDTIVENLVLPKKTTAPFFSYSWSVSDFVAPSTDYAVRVSGVLPSGQVLSQISTPFEIRGDDGILPSDKDVRKCLFLFFDYVSSKYEHLEMVFVFPSYNSIWNAGDTRTISWRFIIKEGFQAAVKSLTLDLWSISPLPQRIMTIVENINLPERNELFRDEYDWTLPLQLPVNISYYIVGVAQLDTGSVVISESDDFLVQEYSQNYPKQRDGTTEDGDGSDGDSDDSVKSILSFLNDPG
jgi:hypothetical protein